MWLPDWIDRHDGIAHRAAADAAGFSRAVIRVAVRSGAVRAVKRNWLATASAHPRLLLAAEHTARLACLSAAVHRGWWSPPDLDDRLHLAVGPHGAVPAVDATVHWSTPLAPAPAWGLLESVEDTLVHLAGCLPREAALTVWESAIRSEGLSIDAVRTIRWPTIAAQECALEATGLSDSGIETIGLRRLRPLGVPIRQQAVIAGRRVDLLLGDRLVVQIDGFGHHSSAAQRAKDIAHDAELTLRGYTVLRFGYAQIVYDWPSVERVIARAIAAGAHRAS